MTPPIRAGRGGGGSRSRRRPASLATTLWRGTGVGIARRAACRARRGVLIAPLLFAIALPRTASAEPWHVGVDSDPSAFALGGGSGWVMVRPPESRVRVGGGLFALRVPGPVSALLDGGDERWDMRLLGVMGHGSVTLLDARRGGPYVGAYAGALETRYGRHGTDERASVWHVTLMPMAGEQWFPFTAKGLDGIYLQPWFGLSIWIPVAGEPVVAGEEFDEPPLVPFPAVHLGYEF